MIGLLPVRVSPGPGAEVAALKWTWGRANESGAAAEGAEKENQSVKCGKRNDNEQERTETGSAEAHSGVDGDDHGLTQLPGPGASFLQMYSHPPATSPRPL